MTAKSRLALFIVAIALVSRILFWQATPDRHWGWSVYYKGDAPLWLEYARAIHRGEPFELGLPIHPPGTAWLVSLLWNGESSRLGWLRFTWILLGALVPLLLFLAAERTFGLRVATIAGGFAAISTGLMILSTTIDSEIPYLLLVIGSMYSVRDLLDEPRISRIAIWSVLNAAACLVRVDHLLFYVLALAFFAVRNRRVLVSIVFFILPLIPWHVSAWSAIHRFNEEPRRLDPAEEQSVSRVEDALKDMTWTEGAKRRRDALPGFAKRTATSFVMATVYFRGGRAIRAEDFGVLEEAFGYFPRPLQRFPFVSLYGPLNFYLANNPRATGGFDRSPLEAPPPLAGGPTRYPSFLIQGLPPAQLSFVYPPHLHLFNEGYSLGWRWIASHPRDFARLVARKLSVFAAGATLGVTGYCASGIRRSVDLVSECGGKAAAFKIPIAGLAILGLIFGWRTLALWPWILFLLSKVVAAALFFGYARQGTLVIPVLAILIGFAIRSPEKRTIVAVVSVLLIALAAQIAQFATKPALLLDGRAVRAIDPDPPDMHRDQIIERLK